MKPNIHTEDFDGEILQRNPWFGRFLRLLVTFFENGTSTVGVPCPTSGRASAQQSEVPITSTQLAPSQTNLLPAEESSARTAKVRRLHLFYRGRHGRCGLLGGSVLWTAIDKRLSNACTTQVISFRGFP
jgi:hypothetical protein